MRASIVGTSGAGKSTFGKLLAERLDCRYVELDAIYHQANWVPLPEDQFRARVNDFVGGEAWVCDGNYSVVHPIVLARATDVIWLDPPSVGRLVNRATRRDDVKRQRDGKRGRQRRLVRRADLVSLWGAPGR